MLVVTRHRPADAEEFLAAASSALAALSARPGCESAEVVRAIDDAGLFLIVSRWQDVGSYRRALSSFEVKLAAVPLLSTAIDEASAFEPRLRARAGEITASEGDLAADADTAGPS